MAEEDADPGEVQVSPMEPVPVPPLAEVIAPTADAPALSVPAAEATRIPAKPMRMYRNPCSQLEVTTVRTTREDLPDSTNKSTGLVTISCLNDLGKISRLVGGVMVMTLISILDSSRRLLPVH